MILEFHHYHHIGDGPLFAPPDNIPPSYEPVNGCTATPQPPQVSVQKLPFDGAFLPIINELLKAALALLLSKISQPKT